MKKNSYRTCIHDVVDKISPSSLELEALIPEFHIIVSTPVDELSLKVLVIDIDSYSNQALMDLLSGAEQVFYVNNLALAKEAVERYEVDYVIIDPASLNMPFFSSFAFIRMLESQYPQIGVMVLTTLRDKLLMQLLRTLSNISIISKYESILSIKKFIEITFNGINAISEYILDLMCDFKVPNRINTLEWNILTLHASSESTASMAKAVCKSINSIYYYIQRIIARLHLDSRWQYLNLLVKLNNNPVL